MKKIGLIALALVLALGSLGIGYALWWDTLYIDGTVMTGILNAEWGMDIWGAEGDWKQVSDVSWDISPDGHTLTLLASNAYPGLQYVWDFNIHNTGTIPLHVGQFIIDWDGIPSIARSYGLQWFGPDQLHAGEEGYGHIWILLNNDTLQDTTYTFSLHLSVGQYNEYPIGAPPVTP